MRFFVHHRKGWLSDVWGAIQSMPLLWQSIVISSLAWLLFSIYSLTYCHLYTSTVLNFSSTFAGSLWWQAKAYGLWWFLTPILLVIYSRSWCSQTYWVFSLGVVSAVAVAAARIAVVAWEEGSVDVVVGFVNFLPEHLIVSLFIVLGWALVFKPCLRRPTSQPSLSSKGSVTAPSRMVDAASPMEKSPSKKHEKLCVQQGNRDVHLRVHQIDCIRAAGNYMEVSSEGQQYLLRATLKELEQRLTSHDFLRTHRSYLVNPRSIDRLLGQKALIMKSGQQLPIGQKHYMAVKTSLKSV